MSEVYDEDYFLRGKETGKSLYSDYRWMPELTVPMVGSIVNHLGVVKGETVLDFGCARGYSVKALRGLGYDAYGVDASKWAVENADPEIKKYCSNILDPLPLVDWVIAKDVLEHIPYVGYTITKLMVCASRGVLAVVPLSPFDSSPYVVEEYELDKTHVQRLTLSSWANMFIRYGWSVEVAYRLPGVKDNYAKYAQGNGFITCRRIRSN